MPLKQDSFNHVQMSCSTAKRQCLESPKRYVNNTLGPLGSKKCGEVLVTNNADKWTFVCTFCQEVTGDIGVFICHIRMQHLEDQQQHQHDLGNESINSNTVNNNTKTNDTVVNDNKQPQRNTFPAILQVTSLAGQSKERSTGEKLRHASSSSSCAEESILPHNTTLQREQSIVNTTVKRIEEVYEVVYLNEDDNKKSKTEPENCIMIDDDDDDEYEDDENRVINEALDNSTQFSYPINDDENSNEDLEFIENYNEDSVLVAASSSSGIKRSRKKKVVDTKDLPFKCIYCNKGFKSKQAIYYHHKTHEKQNQLKCPMCPVSHCTEHLFVSHVLTHESPTCFPCQVCGQASPTNEKRLEHMKTHERERPFGCTYCFRRFRKKHFLTNHLRMHCQYLCDFCPAEFNALQVQRRPYVCPSCESMPDIRRKVEQQRSLAAKNQPLESDQE